MVRGGSFLLWSDRGVGAPTPILSERSERLYLASDATFTYTYNGAGRLVRVEGVTLTVVHTYNANGLRVAQSVDGGVITFAWDWASGVPELLAMTECTTPELTLYLVATRRWAGGMAVRGPITYPTRSDRCGKRRTVQAQ